MGVRPTRQIPEANVSQNAPVICVSMCPDKSNAPQPAMVEPQLLLSMANVTDKLGSGEFNDTLRSFFEQLIEFDSLAALAFTPGGRPQMLWDFSLPGVIGKRASMDHYLAGAYLLDPYFQACQELKGSGFYRLQDIAPDDFHQSEYFRQYFQFAHFGDELGFLFQLPQEQHPGCYVHISLGKRKAFSAEDIKLLRQLSPWVLAIMGQQWQQLNNADDNPMHQRLQQAFRQFGSSFLTQREAETARLLLHGHSTKSMAEKLEISIETIKVHKRNLYTKLDINSQSELFSLFLDSLSLVQAGENQDPLAAYHRPNR